MLKKIFLALAFISSQTISLSFANTSQTHTNDFRASLPTKRETRVTNAIDKLKMELTAYEIELKQLQVERGATEIQPKVIALPEVEQAQNDTLSIKTAPIIEKPARIVDTTLNFNTLQIDSLINEWQERESLENFENFFKQYINVTQEDVHATKRATKSKTLIDSLYSKRLYDLASPVELPYNNIVKDFIDRYISPKSRLMSNVLGRSKYYFPSIEEELMKNDMPVELRAMAIIESGLISKAISPAGAVGLWQFMPATGKMYNLEINTLVDERCDPVKSTKAACEFMNDLYKMYGNWSLAIAAYNCGPGNVNKALARSGLKSGTFWDIYDYLPRETRGYVPAFVAASYAYAYHIEHNIIPAENPIPLATDTVSIKRIMHLGQVAEVLELPIEVLRELNPQYRRDIIPATTKSYPLRLPQRFVSPYIAKEAEIHAKDSAYLKEYINPANIERLRSTPRATIHIVRRGDTLSEIARKYRVSQRQLMQWNNLRSAHRLSIGQRLKVNNK